MLSQVNRISEIGNLLRVIGKRFGITIAFRQEEFSIDCDGYIIRASIWDQKGNICYDVFDPKSPAPVESGFDAKKIAELFLTMLVTKEINELFRNNEIIKILLGDSNG